MAIWRALPPGYVSVGMDVKVRHLKATPVGQMVPRRTPSIH